MVVRVNLNSWHLTILRTVSLWWILRRRRIQQRDLFPWCSAKMGFWCWGFGVILFVSPKSMCVNGLSSRLTMMAVSLPTNKQLRGRWCWLVPPKGLVKGPWFISKLGSVDKKLRNLLRPFSSQIHDEKDGCFGFIGHARCDAFGCHVLAQRQLARKSQDSFQIIRRARLKGSICTSPIIWKRLQVFWRQYFDGWYTCYFGYCWCN